MTEKCHSSHVLRSSDASTFDVVCENCGRHDEVPGGWGRLVEPCPDAPLSTARFPVPGVCIREPYHDGPCNGFPSDTCWVHHPA